MSIWAKTQLLGQDALQQVQSTYSLNNFPLEVRHHFATWIEQQPWKDIDESNPTHESYAVQLLENLVQLLDEKAADDKTDFISKFKFTEFSSKFSDFYSSNPMNLVRVVKACLGKEEMLIQMAENPTQTADAKQSSLTKDIINKEIQDLKKMTDVTEEEVRQMQHKQEQFIILYQRSLQINNQLLQPTARNQAELERKLKQQKDELEKQLLASAQELLTLRLSLSSKHNETINKLDVLQKKVVDGELITWKRRQQLAGNGAPSDAGHLETIQSWCESLAEIIWNNRKQWFKEDILRQQLPIEAPQGTKDYHHELNPRITGLLSSLVTRPRSSTFIVESQPPQVLKKDSRFTATVRLLVGRQLNIYMTPPQVKATIISEAQARALLKNESKAKEENSGEIINHSGTMEYNQASGHLSITFRNMQLKKIKRADRKGTETVAEEKFCILFQSDFTVGGHELVFQVWTLSLPVVVTVHGNQECNAMATVLWDNQFSEPGRTPFHVPDTVQWSDLAEMLNTKFNSMTGRPLSHENISYLTQKLFGTDDPSKTILWSQFNKESLPGRNFTFWEWFYAIMKLTKEHLRNQWSDGLILGFVGKQQSQDQLLKKPNGTFLLRYSDSELGGITIAWVADNPDGERQVWNLAPFTSRDFSIRSLADRIKDLNTLLFLYPDIPKAKAFSKYYTAVTEEQPNKTGYIKSALMSVIPNHPQPQIAALMSFDNPQTPQQYTGPISPTNSLLSHQDSVQNEQSMESDFDDGSIYGIQTDYVTEDLADDLIGQININDLLGLSKVT
uniref:Signal transducer and activator of transcription n=1 Tax=Sinohyriopsis schlegelii TaxID=2706150 RepID=A0A2H4UL82_SINSH|nr:signal transducer and activator of transcription [Sinohyriopsis schlegelii]